MNILLIAYYYPPINSGGTERPLNMAKYLPRFGHYVTVLTHSYDTRNSGDVTTLRIYDPSHNCHRAGMYKALWGSLRLGVETLNCLGCYASIYSLWKHAVLRQADRMMVATRPDVILATYPPVETLEIGLYLSKQYHIPLVADFRDGLLFEPIEQKRMQQYACIRRRYARIEQAVVQAASAILTVSPPITDYFMKYYQGARALTIPNGFDPEDFEHLDDTISLEPEKFHIVHTGRFGGSDAGCQIAPFFHAFAQIICEYPWLKTRLNVHLVGQIDAQELELIKELIREGIVRYHGFQSRQAALSFQVKADVLLLITTVDRKSVATSKLFEYLCAGRPILGLTSQTYAETILRSTGAGWTVHPEDEHGIADLLYKIVTDAEFYRSLRRSESVIAAFSRAAQMERLAQLLNSLGSQ